MMRSTSTRIAADWTLTLAHPLTHETRRVHVGGAGDLNALIERAYAALPPEWRALDLEVVAMRQTGARE